MAGWLRVLLFILVLLALMAKGGMDKMILEDVSLSLIVGIDLDEDGKLVYSTSSPVFSTEAKQKEENYASYATTLRDSREEDDKTFMALTTGGKVQEMVIGKKVMQHKGWIKLLEPFLRDPKNSIRGRMIMVDGNVNDIIRMQPEDKPRLPMYLTKLIDTAHSRNITVKTTLQDLRRDNYEKGKTVSVTELRRKGERIIITGTALLDEEGRYRMSIGDVETKLLLILQNRDKGESSFSFHAPDQPKGGVFPTDAYSFSIRKVSAKIRTGYRNGNFKFDVKVKIRAGLTERLFTLDMRKETGKLEQDINRQLEQRFERFIRSFQAQQIDPVGFGLYARAYEYRHWRTVKDDWGKAMSKADVDVKVSTTIVSMGVTK